MRTGRPKKPLTVSTDEREQLGQYGQRRPSQENATRCTQTRNDQQRKDAVTRRGYQHEQLVVTQRHRRKEPVELAQQQGGNAARILLQELHPELPFPPVSIHLICQGQYLSFLRFTIESGAHPVAPLLAADGGCDFVVRSPERGSPVAGHEAEAIEQPPVA